MKPIAILQHSAAAPPGYLAQAIAAAGLPSIVVRLHEGDPLPAADAVSGIVSLGGPMGAYEEEEHSFLGPEKALLREAVDADIPVLGICLGSQLLADALGGRAYRAGEHEVEFGQLEVAEEALADPVLATLTQPVLSFHGDTFDPPPGAKVLAASRRYPHAFRHGSAVAIQSHPEVSAAIARSWVDLYGRDKLAEAGVDAEELLEAVAAADADTERRAAEMFGAWLGEVIAAQR